MHDSYQIFKYPLNKTRAYWTRGVKEQIGNKMGLLTSTGCPFFFNGPLRRDSELSPRLSHGLILLEPVLRIHLTSLLM